MHVYMPLSIYTFFALYWRGILFQIDLCSWFCSSPMFLGFCFCFRTGTLLHLLCLPFCWYLPLHTLNLLMYLSNRNLNQFTRILPPCFPAEKTLLSILHISRPHFFTSYLLFNNGNEAISTAPWPSYYELPLFLS